jgi:signal transduction histidine kinase
MRILGSRVAEPAAVSPAALSLASGVDTLWAQWQEDRRLPRLLAGRRSLVLNDRSVFLLWRGTQSQLVALVGGPDFLAKRIVAPLRDLLKRQGVGVALADGEGQTLVSGEVPTGSIEHHVLRTMADTRLPWMLRIATTDAESDLTYVASRGRLLFGGFAVLGLLAVAGTYFSVRVISREVEIARLQSEFVAAVSHEFRTPLTTLRQFTDLLVDGRVATDDDRQKYYAALRRGTRRLNHLVENLLDFGRMEAGFHRFNPRSINAKDWAEHVVADFQQDVVQSGHSIELTWDAPVDTIIQGDEATLGRALWNLLDNAVKYSPEYKTILVTGVVKENEMILSVHDRGFGVPDGEQREIFRKFVRGSSSSIRTITGTGLGLALVDQILRSHRGKVKLESVVDQGSTFSLILPVG